MLMFRKAIEVAGEIGTQKLGIARSALLTEDRLTQDVVLWRKSTTEFNDFFSTSEIWEQIRMHEPVTA
ncbi:hypothetical protein F2Q69_00055114 [Brassica cretica]|uniref:Uncharacterized protein n=1 Tax=Brassica cretica TaxID=69181 RepID=A0A8S9MZY5_BRACR|nr:hypothetical protein F2Q69_00055114 [Brassica cretica]